MEMEMEMEGAWGGRGFEERRWLRVMGMRFGDELAVFRF